MIELSRFNYILCHLNLGHVEAAKMLIENGAEIDARDKYFNNPLHIACSHGILEDFLFEILISCSGRRKTKKQHS